MFYIFKKDPLAASPVNFSCAATESILRNELKKAEPNALFIYNEHTDELKILSTYYDVLECSYFIYTLLGIFKPTYSLKLIYPAK